MITNPPTKCPRNITPLIVLHHGPQGPKDRTNVRHKGGSGILIPEYGAVLYPPYPALYSPFRQKAFAGSEAQRLRSSATPRFLPSPIPDGSTEQYWTRTGPGHPQRRENNCGRPSLLLSVRPREPTKARREQPKGGREGGGS